LRSKNKDIKHKSLPRLQKTGNVLWHVGQKKEKKAYSTEYYFSVGGEKTETVCKYIYPCVVYNSMMVSVGA
jgi:hypothetical protein